MVANVVENIKAGGAKGDVEAGKGLLCLSGHVCGHVWTWGRKGASPRALGKGAVAERKASAKPREEWAARGAVETGQQGGEGYKPHGALGGCCKPSVVILHKVDSCRVFLSINVLESYQSSIDTSGNILCTHQFISLQVFLWNEFSEVQLLGQRVYASVILVDAVQLPHEGNSSFLESS